MVKGADRYYFDSLSSYDDGSMLNTMYSQLQRATTRARLCARIPMPERTDETIGLFYATIKKTPKIQCCYTTPLENLLIAVLILRKSSIIVSSVVCGYRRRKGKAQSLSASGLAMKRRVLLIVVVRSSTLPFLMRSEFLVVSGLGNDLIGAMAPKLRSSLLPLPVERLVFVFLTK